MAGRRKRKGRLGLLILVIFLALVIAGGYILWQGGYLDGLIPPPGGASDSDGGYSDSSSEHSLRASYIDFTVARR